MQIYALNLLSLWAGFAVQTVLASSSQCKPVTFQVNGNAVSRNFTGISFNDPSAFLNLVNGDNFPRIPVSGTQTLAGIYCEPNATSSTRLVDLDAVRNSNNGKLQVLFHSIAANRATWAALGETQNGNAPYKTDQYSWVKYANNQGYPTLAIDRLGNGFSSHPDPVLVVQGPYEDALYHDLAQQIRAGTTNCIPHYSFLIWVGNSYGSELGTTSAQKYPDDWNAYILTGFSKAVQQDFVGVSLVLPAPAAVADPARFGNLAPGYVTPTSPQGVTNSFFGSTQQVSFESTVASLFFTRRDTVSIGQFVSVYAPFQIATAPQYTGRVLVLTGEQDQAFCGPGSPVIGPAHCGPLLQQTGSLFPAAQYNYQSIDKTGHATQLHLSSQKVFSVAHRFLAGETFQGGAPL